AAVIGCELPVREGTQVAKSITDSGAKLLCGRTPHVVEVHHNGDRDVDAVGALAPLVVVERGDRRGNAVVSEGRGDRDHGEGGRARRVLRDIERAAAANADDCVMGTLTKLIDELERRGDAASTD